MVSRRPAERCEIGGDVACAGGAGESARADQNLRHRGKGRVRL